MYCKRLKGQFLFTIQPIARWRGPSVLALPVSIFSNGCGTDWPNSDTSLDPHHISDAQTMDITRFVGWLPSLFWVLSAGAFLPG